MKRRIRLNESQLRETISESVKSILKEYNGIWSNPVSSDENIYKVSDMILDFVRDNKIPKSEAIEGCQLAIDSMSDYQ